MKSCPVCYQLCSGSFQLRRRQILGLLSRVLRTNEQDDLLRGLNKVQKYGICVVFTNFPEQTRTGRAFKISTVKVAAQVEVSIKGAQSHVCPIHVT